MKNCSMLFLGGSNNDLRLVKNCFCNLIIDNVTLFHLELL